MLIAGLSIVATEVLRGYQAGVLTPRRFMDGDIPMMSLLAVSGGLVLSLFLWLALRASGIAAETASEGEREARELLSLQSRRFHTLEREGWDGVMIVDHLGVIRWIGVTAARMLRFDPQEVVGETILSLVHFSDVDGFLAALSVEKDDSWSFEFRMSDADDRVRWFEGVMSNHVDDDAVSGVVLHLRDTTDWHAVEQTIRDRDDHVRAAFDHSPFGAAVVDADGVLRSVSAALAAMMDKDAASLSGRPIGALLSPRDRAAVRGAIRKMKTSEDDPLERDVVLANGSRAVLALTPIPGPPREVRSYLLQVVWRAYADETPAVLDAPEEAIEIVDQLIDQLDVSVLAKDLVDEDFEGEEDDEDDFDVVAEETAATFAEFGAPNQGWADAIVDLDIEIDEEAPRPAQGPSSAPVAPTPPTDSNPILRAIASAHRADRQREDDPPADENPDFAMLI